MPHKTLAQALEDSKVDMHQLEHEYGPLLTLVRALIGVVPNCDSYLEMWPPAFRTYNLLVPNALNLPQMLFGLGVRKDLVGLAMYAASRGAECMYCSAHCCSFALRRGASVAAVQGQGAAAEQAVWNLAQALGQMPPQLHQGHVDALAMHLSADDREWILWGAALMGFLGKFMDTMGIELEPEAIADVQAIIGGTGWHPGKHLWNPESSPGLQAVPTDDFALYVRVLRQMPAALRLQQRWSRGLGFTADSALQALERAVGHGFHRLRMRKHQRPVIAVAAVLRDQLDPTTSTLGLMTKCLMGKIFAEFAANDGLIEDMQILLKVHSPELNEALLQDVRTFALNGSNDEAALGSLPTMTRAALLFAKRIAPSPAPLSADEIAEVTGALTPLQIVEAVTWLAVLQMMHRLYTYDAVALAQAA